MTPFTSLILVVLAVATTAQTSRLWDISPPSQSYSGLQLNLDYTVRDQVRESYVTVELFRDAACQLKISDADNTYIAIDVVNDMTSFGNGSGTRKVWYTMVVCSRSRIALC